MAAAAVGTSFLGTANMAMFSLQGFDDDDLRMLEQASEIPRQAFNPSEQGVTTLMEAAFMRKDTLAARLLQSPFCDSTFVNHADLEQRTSIFSIGRKRSSYDIAPNVSQRYSKNSPTSIGRWRRPACTG
jgi:hypothetical protein